MSLVTPCHNSGKFIHRLLDSVLEQTYGQIEMITVDNASEDDTPDIIMSYMPKFEAKGYSLNYVRQDDLGPSAGIQTGLRLITGEFLLMPDSDDWYAKSRSIETFVNKFKDLPDEYAIVRCQQNYVEEETMNIIGIAYKDATEDDPGTLFEDCLFGKNGYNFAPINYMVRVSALRKETNLKIYNAYNTGQQRQICLPLYYNYKTWTIKEPLVCYLVRRNSVSHREYAQYPSQLKLYKKSKDYIDSILFSIKSMPEDEKERYCNSFMKMTSTNICLLAMRCDKNQDLKFLLEDYRKYGGKISYMRFKCIEIGIKRFVNKLLGR